MTIARTMLCLIALLAWVAACSSGEEGATPSDSEATAAAAPSDSEEAAAAPAAEAESTPEDDLEETGTFTLTLYRASFIGSAAVSNGVLRHAGHSRKFHMTGLGIGGVGLSKADATGTVYNLQNVEDFAGTYVQARSGITIGGDALKRRTWMANDRGVKLDISWESKGLQLNLGADGMIVTWDD
jgi:hypothetical protein